METILIVDGSLESEEAAILLEESKIKFEKFPFEYRDVKPPILNWRGFSFSGLNEIKKFLLINKRITPEKIKQIHDRIVEKLSQKTDFLNNHFSF